MAKVDRLGWAATTSIHAGAAVLGVRSNTAELDRALREMLAAHVVVDPAVNRNYSLQVNEPRAGRPRPFHLLFEGCTLVWRSTSFASVLDELLCRLDGHIRSRDASVVGVEAFAVVRAGVAALLPSWVGRSARDRARLQRVGFGIVGGQLPELALGSGRLIVRDHAVRVDSDAASRWLGRYNRGVEDPPADRVRPDEYPLAAWLFFDRSGEDVLASPAEALARAVKQARTTSAVGTGPTVATLAAALRHAHVDVVPRQQRDVTAVITALMPGSESENTSGTREGPSQM